MTVSTARAKLVARIGQLTSSQIMAAHAEIESMPEAEKGPEHRLTAALLADEITERFGLDEELDRIFGDDTFGGTYHDALELALDRVANLRI